MKNIYFILGGPGSGKGTQCKLLEEKYGYKHISAGDLLREEKKKNKKNSEIINNCIDNGLIVPSKVTIDLLNYEITNSINQKFLIDGFPRNLENLNEWNNLKNNDLEIKKVIYFDCPEKILISRLVERGKTSNRTDDNMEIIKKRLQIFNESTAKNLNYFKKNNLIEIVKTNKDINLILNDLEKIIS